MARIKNLISNNKKKNLQVYRVIDHVMPNISITLIGPVDTHEIGKETLRKCLCCFI
jgi:hypothetical protein